MGPHRLQRGRWLPGCSDLPFRDGCAEWGRLGPQCPGPFGERPAPCTALAPAGAAAASAAGLAAAAAIAGRPLVIVCTCARSCAQKPSRACSAKPQVRRGPVRASCTARAGVGTAFAPSCTARTGDCRSSTQSMQGEGEGCLQTLQAASHSRPQSPSSLGRLGSARLPAPLFRPCALTLAKAAPCRLRPRPPWAHGPHYKAHRLLGHNAFTSGFYRSTIEEKRAKGSRPAVPCYENESNRHRHNKLAETNGKSAQQSLPSPCQHRPPTRQ